MVVGKDSNTQDCLYVGSDPSEKVSDYKYLGVYIRNTSREFNIRKAQACSLTHEDCWWNEVTVLTRKSKARIEWNIKV